jgi:hypothetical protein
MKKTLVIVGAAFLVAMAVGTALGVVLSPGKKGDAATEGSAAADSLHAVAPAKDGERGLETQHPEPHPPVVAAMSESAPALPVAGTESPATGELHRKIATGDSGVEFDELSRILGMLPPSEAALFLDHLENDLALGILRSMSVRQASVVIANCSDSKAAWLKSRLLDLPSEDR